MTAAPIDRRSLRAKAIVERQDVHLSQPGLWRVRDTTGSGVWHYVTEASCDCWDFKRTGLACKHLLALRAELAKQPKCPGCDDAPANTKDRDHYCEGCRMIANVDGPDNTPAPVCPTCKGKTRADQAYVGGRGYLWFWRCTRDKYHKATRLS